MKAAASREPAGASADASAAAASGLPLLDVRDIEVVYQGVILAVHGVSLSVPQGSVVSLLGANGAGKTTTLKAISQLIGAERGKVTAGSIRYENHDIGLLRPDQLVERGLVQVLEGRHCFAHLTVEENLMTGAFVRKPSRSELKQGLERIFEYLPRLKARRKQLAGYVSGGEQQMVAIGRALIATPKLMLLDEPSMGLAPQIVEEIFEILRRLNRHEGLGILLAEQNVGIVLRYADHGYILENGRVAHSGSSEELKQFDGLHEFYLGSRPTGTQAA